MLSGFSRCVALATIFIVSYSQRRPRRTLSVHTSDHGSIRPCDCPADSYYSTREHIYIKRCRLQSVEKTSFTASERTGIMRSETESDSHGGHLDTEAEEVLRVEEAGSTEREAPTRNIAQEVFFVRYDFLLQLNCRTRKELENITTLTFSANLSSKGAFSAREKSW